MKVTRPLQDLGDSCGRRLRFRVIANSLGVVALLRGHPHMHGVRRVRKTPGSQPANPSPRMFKAAGGKAQTLELWATHHRLHRHEDDDDLGQWPRTREEKLWGKTRVESFVVGFGRFHLPDKGCSFAAYPGCSPKGRRNSINAPRHFTTAELDASWLCRACVLLSESARGRRHDGDRRGWSSDQQPHLRFTATLPNRHRRLISYEAQCKSGGSASSCWAGQLLFIRKRFQICANSNSILCKIWFSNEKWAQEFELHRQTVASLKRAKNVEKQSKTPSIVLV